MSLSVLHCVSPASDIETDPVLLCNDLGAKREATNLHDCHPAAVVASSGHHSMSVKEAVRIAQSNNFMGLVCSSRLLVSRCLRPLGELRTKKVLLMSPPGYGPFPHRIHQGRRPRARYRYLGRSTARRRFSFVQNA